MIGSGISGALTAHALCNAGFNCTRINKRIASVGSSVIAADVICNQLLGKEDSRSALFAFGRRHA